MPDRPAPFRTFVTALVAILVPLVLVAVAILPFLTPAWVAPAQARAEVTAWTGFPEPVVRRVTDAIVHDLVLGPPRFDVAVDGVPVLGAREIEHMQQVRVVFGEFYLVAALAAAALVIVGIGIRPRTAFWRGLFVGGALTAVVMVLAGAVVVVAFDAAFEVFHRLFFPAGSYTFDPRTDRLVQLFPDRFWSETSAVVGIVIFALAILVAWIGRRRVRRAAADPRSATGVRAGAEGGPGADGTHAPEPVS